MDDMEFFPQLQHTGASPSSHRSSRVRRGSNNGTGDLLFGVDGPDEMSVGEDLGASELTRQNDHLRRKVTNELLALRQRVMIWCTAVQAADLTAEIKSKNSEIESLEKAVASDTSRKSSCNWHDRMVVLDVLHSLDNMGFGKDEVRFMLHDVTGDGFDDCCLFCEQVENLFEEMGDDQTPSLSTLESSLSAEDRTNLDSLLFSNSDKASSLDQYASALSATSGYAGFMYQAKG
jgi:hypothetical protein